MYHNKLMKKQLQKKGLRICDECKVYPSYGHKKTIHLNRYEIDIVSEKYRPHNLAMKFFELPKESVDVFHYRLEMEQKDINNGRFHLRTLEGYPYSLNGIAVRDAYLERNDVVKIGDSKLSFLEDPSLRLNEEKIIIGMTTTNLLQQENLIMSSMKILIQGETGTGKTYLARKIHEKSHVPGKFMGINLSSYNSQLIESELFGHKKGSFTGAYQDKVGAFEHAEYGTLFLDEVDSLPWDLQTKLLTFLDQNSFRKVGDSRERKIKTRLIFASGQNLKRLVDQGKFRKDFYFRLISGHVEKLLPLREDVQKIKKTCEYFSSKFQISLSERLLDFYMTLPWPGNYRQLLGHLEKKKILSKSARIDFDHIDDELLLESTDLESFNKESSKTLPLKKIKSVYAKSILLSCDGSLKLAAKKLEISPRVLKNILSQTT